MRKMKNTSNFCSTINFLSKLLLVGSLGRPATKSGRVVTANGEDDDFRSLP